VLHASHNVLIFIGKPKNIFNNTNHRASPRSYLPHSNILMDL
jgi:hypothetical protein